MTVELADVMAHVATATGGASGVGVVARFFFKSWQKRVEKIEKSNEKRHEENVKVLGEVKELLTRLDERVKTLQEGQEKLTDARIKLAVLEERTEKNKNDLNGIGAKLREFQNS